MPPIQKNSVVLKKRASKVWIYFGDNLVGKVSSVQVQPNQRFAKAPQSLEKPPASTPQEGVRGHGEGGGGGEEAQGPHGVKNEVFPILA